MLETAGAGSTATRSTSFTNVAPFPLPYKICKHYKIHTSLYSMMSLGTLQKNTISVNFTNSKNTIVTEFKKAVLDHILEVI